MKHFQPRSLDVIARQIVNVDPALNAAELLRLVPRAKVTKLRNGCVVTITVRESDLSVTPDVHFQFDHQARIVSAAWGQFYPDASEAFDVFDQIERVARRHMLVRPTQRITVGSRKARSSFGYDWRVSDHQGLTLAAAQPRVRDRGREISLRHRLRQTEAKVASTPALWGG